MVAQAWRKMVGFLRRRKEEEEMLVITCAYCGATREISVHNSSQWIDNRPHTHTHYDEFSIVVTCGACGKKTLIGLEGDRIVFMPGKLFEEEIDKRLSLNTRELFNDAILAFYGNAFRGTVALCRSCVEDALNSKNAGKPHDSLDDRIPIARAGGLLGDQEVTQAHAARLAGRNTLHRGMSVNKTQALLALRATLDLLNHIASKPSLPAS